MSRSIAGKIKINSFADIVGGDDAVVTEVPLADLHDFKDHPFRVLDDEKMEKIVESVKKYGVLMPGMSDYLLCGERFDIIANIDAVNYLYAIIFEISSGTGNSS